MSKVTNYIPSPAIDPRDIETRKELLPAQETTEDMYRPDTNADPEGCEARRKAQEDAQFADWIFNDYELDLCKVQGVINPGNKKLYMFSDGKYHLRPKVSLINRVMGVHTDGMGTKNIESMKELSDTGDSNEHYKCLSKHYEEMINELPSEYHFSIISGVGEAVVKALADRAFQKDKVMQLSFSQDAEIPEWVSNYMLNATNASTRAGIWYKVHHEVWSQAGWRSSPSYQDFLIEKEIANRCQKDADYKDANKKGTRKEVTVSDWSALDVSNI